MTENDQVIPVKNYRTAIGNRTFSARSARIWEPLPDDLRMGDIHKRNTKESIKKEIKKWNCEWILWGNEREGRTRDRNTGNTTDH